jgi:hypothetical protein
MPYIIQEAPGPAPVLLVGERYWGYAPEIDFGSMTSCIALVQQDPDDPTAVRAIHLSVVSQDGTPVYDPDSDVAAQISAIMQAQGDFRACLGRIDFWQNNQSTQVQDFFSSLMQDLDIFTWVQLPDGNLGARWNNNTIQYNAQGSGWLDIPYV